MFGTGKKGDKKASELSMMPRDQAPDLLIVAPEPLIRDRDQLTAEALQLPAGQRCSVVSPFDQSIVAGISSPYVLSLFNSPLDLDTLSDKVIAARSAGLDTVMIIAVNPTQLVALGQWLDKRASAGRLQGLRLMIASDLDGVRRQVLSRMKPVTEDNVIRMPATTEVDNTAFKNFFVFSPELHALVARIRGFAGNGISRACLLGGTWLGQDHARLLLLPAAFEGQVRVGQSGCRKRPATRRRSSLCSAVTSPVPSPVPAPVPAPSSTPVTASASSTKAMKSMVR